MTRSAPRRYIRARIRIPSEETERAAHDKYVEAEKAIAGRLFKWSEKRRRARAGEPNREGPEQVHPICQKQAAGIARELLAAVHRATHSAPVTEEVWRTYVNLYEAMHRLQAALSAVAALPFAYRHLEDELTAMARVLDNLMLPAESASGEAAIFRSDGVRYVFQKRQRGRSKNIRAEIVRQAIAVWLHRFKAVPPAYPNSVFDEVLRHACEYHGMNKTNWPGLVVIRAELSNFVRGASSADIPQPDLLRFYPGRTSE